MSSLRALLMFCCLTPLLTSCQEEPSYSYLMKHPLYTAKQALRCESLRNPQIKSSFCARVQEASQNLFAILKQQQLDPEGFGYVIMETQISAGKISDQLNKAKRQSVPKHEQESHQKKIRQLESLLRIQQEKIQILLAVVGMGRPD